MEVFQVFEVERPDEWLKLERTNERPSQNVWSGELFGLDEFSDQFMKEAETILSLAGFVVKEEKDPAIQSAGDVGMLVMTILDPESGKVSIYAQEDGILVMSKGQIESKFFSCVDGGAYYPIYSLSISFALLHSWQYNSDRERAHKAREYLCDAVEQLLKKSEE